MDIASSGQRCFIILSQVIHILNGQTRPIFLLLEMKFQKPHDELVNIIPRVANMIQQYISIDTTTNFLSISYPIPRNRQIKSRNSFHQKSTYQKPIRKMSNRSSSPIEPSCNHVSESVNQKDTYRRSIFTAQPSAESWMELTNV